MPQPHESSQSPMEINQFLINQIASGLSTTTELIQSLSAELRDTSVELAIIKTDLSNVTQDVKALSIILREGNGTAPVLSRIAILETTTAQLNTTFTSIEHTADKTKSKVEALVIKTAELADNNKLAAEDKKSRRQAIIAIITSIVALIAAIAVALIG